MSFKLKFQPGGSAAIATLNVPTNTTILKDQLLALDLSNDGVIPATSSSTTLTAFAVAQAAVTTVGSVGSVRCILIQPGQIWEADCTNNTAANQRLNRHALSSGVAVNNTSSDVTDNTGVITILRTIGAASDKKAEVLINRAIPV